MATDAVEIDTSDYITTYESIGGWKAIHLWWNLDFGGFWEPYQTGIGAYGTESEADAEAQHWACDEGIRYVPSKRMRESKGKV